MDVKQQFLSHAHTCAHMRARTHTYTHAHTHTHTLVSKQTQHNSQLTKHLPAGSRQGAAREHRGKSDEASVPGCTSAPDRTWSGCPHSRPPAHSPVTSSLSAFIIFNYKDGEVSQHPTDLQYKAFVKKTMLLTDL